MGRLADIRRPSVPLYLELADILRSRIARGEFPPGGRLPTLKEMTRDLGVSRVTVRQSMQILESEGLIERGSGRGTFVRDTPRPSPEVLKLNGDMASLLRLVRGSRATEVHPPLGVNKPPHFLRDDPTFDPDKFQLMRRIHSKGDQPFSLVDLCIRREIYDLDPDAFRSEIAIIVLDKLEVEIGSADQIISVGTADMDVASYLGMDVNAPIADVFRTFRDPQKQILYAAHIRYPATFISFHIQFE